MAQLVSGPILATLTLAVGPARAQVAPSPQSEPAAQFLVPGLSVNSTLGGGWESNPAFLTVQDPSGLGFGRGSLSYTWVAPRLAVTANAGGEASLYAQGSARERYTYRGGLTAAITASAQTTVTLGASAGQEYTDHLTDPSTVGLGLPISQTQSYEGNASIVRRFGTRTQLELSGNYSQFRFDSPTLADGTSVSGQAVLGHQVSTRDTIDLNYSYQTNDYETSGRTHIHTIASGYGRTLGPRVKVSLVGGADARKVTGLETGWSLYVDANLDARWQRSAFKARYRQGINPGPGIGQDRAMNLVEGSFTATLSRRVSLGLSGSYGLNESPTEGDASYDTQDASAFLRFMVARTLSLVLEQQYRRRGEYRDSPPVDNFRTALSLDFGKVFR